MEADLQMHVSRPQSLRETQCTPFPKYKRRKGNLIQPELYTEKLPRKIQILTIRKENKTPFELPNKFFINKL